MKQLMSISRAMDAPSQPCLLEESAGKIAAEFVYLYPPGIPILSPGEVITKEIVDYIFYAKAKGCSMQGPEDPEIEYLNVLKGGRP